MSKLRDEALHMHKVNGGKLAINSKVAVKNANDLSLAYSRGWLSRVKKFMQIVKKCMIIR